MEGRIDGSVRGSGGERRETEESDCSVNRTCLCVRESVREGEG